jgi:hypothetical protein
MCHPDDPVKASALSSDIFQPQHKLQLFMAREYYEQKQKNVLSHQYILRQLPATQSRFRTIIDSSRQKLSYSWIFALPNVGLGQQITQQQFHVLMRLRLLMPLFPSEINCPIPRCKQTLDVFGYHALSCHDGRFARHQVIRNALHLVAFKAGYHPISDAPVGCLGSKPNGIMTVLRPADLLIMGLDDYSRDCVDVTIVSPFAKNQQPGLGVRVRAAEIEKYRKHEDACHVSGYGFRAFAIDALGNIPERSSALLARLQSAIALKTGREHSLVVNDVNRQVSCALQVAVACQLLSHRPITGFGEDE